MSQDAAARAEAFQRAASDPEVSAFVSASAGSGKTKLLTDRLLRLMLAGADPARIQCLTFTKAAAAEMSLRLQARLGEWVSLDDAALDARLAALDVAATPETRRRARSLFALVLDLPGGMRIGTIHAFCQSLLRRFPLEAELSPHFQVVEEADGLAELDAAREDMLAEASPARQQALDRLAGLVSAEEFGRLLARLQGVRDRLQEAFELPPEALAAAMRQIAGAQAPDEAALLAGAAAWPAAAALAEALRVVQQQGSPAVRDRAARMLDWLSLPPARRAAAWEDWLCELLTGKGEARAASGFCNAALARLRPDICPLVTAEQDRVLAVEECRRALRMAEASAALLTLARPMLRDYARRKDLGGLLDYDDLIGLTSKLLVDPGAAWVLYKLDGGLDHLLLDEVQDTAPAQWRIAHALTAEFFAGAGARDVRRSFFAVGDPKQSIYSFQGADPDEFERSRRALRQRVENAGQTWRDVPLDVSFRSAAPVLELVDAVFADSAAAAGVAEAGTLRHYANRAGDAGRVELWPLAPVPDGPEAEPWKVPDRHLTQSSALQCLARILAAWIREQTSGHIRLESQDRPLAPGDVLVLVRRRNDFARALVRALKAEGVPVAGLDRLVLTEQPAVQDLMSLCDALLLPQDELSLACVLTSPLGGLSDDSLMQLAAGRAGGLWETLRARAAEREDWRQAWTMLSALLARVDYATPHALLAEALGPLGGRARLLARLGPDATEPIDELLNAALTYARAHPPSLQGFLHWLRRSAAEVKREPEGAGGAVRIMTVHGAKGLQAPLVILPDTTALPPDDGPLLWAADPGTGIELPVWAPRKEFHCGASDRARQARAQRRMEEHNRLLYVALTRAEDRLVVCGWQPRRRPPEECWYNLVQRGFERLRAAEEAFAGWEGTMRLHQCRQTRPPRRPAARPSELAPAPLPAWAGCAPDWRPLPPPPEPAQPKPLAPSRPDGVELGPVPAAASPLSARPAGGARFRRGQVVHALLQHLPGLPPERRLEAVRAYLARWSRELAPAEQADLARQVMAILDHPELAPLFGPGSRAEQAVTGLVGDQVVNGVIDRLAVLPGRVLIADFKTGREAPAQPGDTPARYLRQIAAYRALLRGIYPDRELVCALIWTQGAAVTLLPDALLEAYRPGLAPVAEPARA